MDALYLFRLFTLACFVPVFSFPIGLRHHERIFPFRIKVFAAAVRQKSLGRLLKPKKPSFRRRTLVCGCDNRDGRISSSTKPFSIDAPNADEEFPMEMKKDRTDRTVDDHAVQPIEKGQIHSIGINVSSSINTYSVTSSNELPIQSVVLLLTLVAVLWGTQHAIIKAILVNNGESSSYTGESISSSGNTMDHLVGGGEDPAVFTLVRFGLGAFLASLGQILLPARTRRNHFSSSLAESPSSSSQSSYSYIRWGSELGLWMFLGFCFQAIGLQYTTASKSGFLLYLNVKFVPLLARILYGRDISIASWLSAAVTFVGTLLLTASQAFQVDHTSFHNLNTPDHMPIMSSESFSSFSTIASSVASLNVGDLWTVAAAAVSAMFILRLERASEQVHNANALNLVCLWMVTLLSLLWTLVAMASTTDIPHLSSTANNAKNLLVELYKQMNHLFCHHTGELLYLSGVATALANWMQVIAQRHISAEKASVFYAMDPVYGTLFAHFYIGEHSLLNSPAAWVGAALITCAAATNAFMQKNS